MDDHDLMDHRVRLAKVLALGDAVAAAQEDDRHIRSWLRQDLRNRQRGALSELRPSHFPVLSDSTGEVVLR